MMQFNMGYRSKKRVRRRAGAVSSSGPGQPVFGRRREMLTDPSEMQLHENVNCAPICRLREEYCRSPQAPREHSTVLSSTTPAPLSRPLQRINKIRLLASI